MSEKLPPPDENAELDSIVEIRRLENIIDEAKSALHYSLVDEPEKRCDKIIWRANMDAWKALHAK